LHCPRKCQVSNLVWGDENAKKQLLRLQGPLYHYVTETGWTLLLSQCAATISRSETEFQYILTLTNIENESRREPNVNWSFLITPSMQVCREKGPGNNAVSFWGDDVRYLLEYSPNHVKLAAAFVQTLCQCMYEYQQRQSHYHADEATIMKFEVSPKSIVFSTSLQEKKSHTQNGEANTNQMQNVSQTAISIESESIGEAHVLISRRANFLVFSETESQFKLLEENVTAQINNISTRRDEFKFELCVLKGTEFLLRQIIDNEMHPQFFKRSPSTPNEGVVGSPTANDFILNVKLRFSSQPAIFQQFLTILNEYHTKKCNLQEVFTQTNELFKGHSDLIEEFCRFLHSETTKENREVFGFVWYSVKDDTLFTWCLQFDPEDEDKWKSTFLKCLWETNTQEPFERVAKREDESWIFGAYDNDVEMEEDDGITDEDRMEFSDDDGADNSLDNDTFVQEEEQKGIKNSHLAVGYTHDRSFVVRGSRIGVFQHTDNKLKFHTTIKHISDPSAGTVFSPKKVILHQQDSSMLLLHPHDATKVFKMDLERGKVVEEWRTEGQALQELVPETKYAPTTPTPTLIGVNNTGFFVMDPRLPNKSKVVTSRCFQYSAGAQTRFSCAATTSDGHLAVGSKKGTIHLYNAKLLEGTEYTKDVAKIGGVGSAPRAKTTLPGCGDPILGIDVTGDGKWILATCKTYLLVIPTALPEGNLTGFQKSLGKHKPIPRRLQLKREHLKLVGGKVHSLVAENIQS
jgi:hypothetical protein